MATPAAAPASAMPHRANNCWMRSAQTAVIGVSAAAVVSAPESATAAIIAGASASEQRAAADISDCAASAS